MLERRSTRDSVELDPQFDGCGRRVQGRHPLQTSDALGAAAVQLGPDAVATAAVLNKQLGLSFGKVAAFFGERFGLHVRWTSAPAKKKATYTFGKA